MNKLSDKLGFANDGSHGKRMAKSESPSKTNLKNTPLTSEKSNFCPNKKTLLCKSNTMSIETKYTNTKSPSILSPNRNDSPQSQKLSNILLSIEEVLSEEQKQTESLVKNIDRQVNAINKRFDKTSQNTKKLEKFLFTRKEQEVMINDFNQSVDTMFTYNSSGIKYFKNKILKQSEQLV